MDASRVIPALEFLHAGLRYLGIEEHLAAARPACGVAGDNTRHACLCHRAGAQINQHQLLAHATSHFLKGVSAHHQVESGAPFDAHRGLRKDAVIERGGLRDATASDFQHESTLIDVTYADPQAEVHLSAESADQDGSATSISGAPKRSHQPVAIAMDGNMWASWKRRQRIYRPATVVVTNVIAGRNGGPWSRKGPARNVFYSISLTPKAAISRRVHHQNEFASRDLRVIERSRGEKGVRWSWRGISTQTLRRELYELDGRMVLKDWRDATVGKASSVRIYSSEM